MIYLNFSLNNFIIKNLLQICLKNDKNNVKKLTNNF